MAPKKGNILQYKYDKNQLRTSYLRRKSLSHSFSSVTLIVVSSFASDNLSQASPAILGSKSVPPGSSFISSFQSRDWLSTQT